MTLPEPEPEREDDFSDSLHSHPRDRISNSCIAPRRLARLLDDGLQFGKYRVVRLIAIGGMSEIYEAIHLGLKKCVALKVMRRDLAESPEARQRFIAEGINAARLRHTNVVDVTDVGEVDELPYLVMNLLEGEDLGRVLDRERSIPIADVIDLLLPVASAVALGHDKGVVHRDLKPDNIFLHREGVRVIPKVLDFGVSRVMDARRITLNASVFGTPHYMSPEQARGGPTDERTDQYSLGVILYEAVTGHLPRDSTNPIELLHAVAYDSFLPPSKYRDIPAELEAVILRAMAHEPADRFPSMRDLALALVPFASESVREYWSVELEQPSGRISETRVPQPVRHPSPAPEVLAFPHSTDADASAMGPSTELQALEADLASAPERAEGFDEDTPRPTQLVELVRRSTSRAERIQREAAAPRRPTPSHPARPSVTAPVDPADRTGPIRRPPVTAAPARSTVPPPTPPRILAVQILPTSDPAPSVVESLAVPKRAPLGPWLVALTVVVAIAGGGIWVQQKRQSLEKPIVADAALPTKPSEPVDAPPPAAEIQPARSALSEDDAPKLTAALIKAAPAAPSLPPMAATAMRPVPRTAAAPVVPRVPSVPRPPSEVVPAKPAAAPELSSRAPEATAEPVRATIVEPQRPKVRLIDEHEPNIQVVE